MKSTILDILGAVFFAACIFLPFAYYFWSMKP